jgi:hypothetical protein
MNIFASLSAPDNDLWCDGSTCLITVYDENLPACVNLRLLWFSVSGLLSKETLLPGLNLIFLF